MIQKKDRYVDWYTVQKHIKETRGRKPSELDGEEALGLISGNYEMRGRYRLIDTCWRPDTKWWHRLNRFWAWPFSLMCAPFQYVAKGYTGWEDNGRFGNWLLRVTGYR